MCHHVLSDVALWLFFPTFQLAVIFTSSPGQKRSLNARISNAFPIYSSAFHCNRRSLQLEVSIQSQVNIFGYVCSSYKILRKIFTPWNRWPSSVDHPCPWPWSMSVTIVSQTSPKINQQIKIITTLAHESNAALTGSFNQVLNRLLRRNHIAEIDVGTDWLSAAILEAMPAATKLSDL